MAPTQPIDIHETSLDRGIPVLNTWYRQLLDHPTYRWILIVGTLVYFLSPIDLAPDMIPLLGQVDDAVMMTLLVSALFRWMSDRVTARATATDATQAETGEAPTQVIDVDAVSLD
jgi:uncharacterized membrane protein YkvA (DUF1232 family)